MKFSADFIFASSLAEAGIGSRACETRDLAVVHGLATFSGSGGQLSSDPRQLGRGAALGDSASESVDEDFGARAGADP